MGGGHGLISATLLRGLWHAVASGYTAVASFTCTSWVSLSPPSTFSMCHVELCSSRQKRAHHWVRHTHPEMYRHWLVSKGSSVDIWNNVVVNPDPDPHVSALIWVAVSGSRRAKMTHKYRKKLWIFMFWRAGCSLLRAECFSCSLCGLYGGLTKCKCNFRS